MSRKKKNSIAVSRFVLKAIKVLCTSSHALGIHAEKSGLLGAIMQEYGKEVHPVTLLREVIKSGVVLAKPAKEGVMLYDLKNVKANVKRQCLRRVDLRINALSAAPIKTYITDLIHAVFDWSSAGVLCGGEMLFAESGRVTEKTRYDSEDCAEDDIHIITARQGDVILGVWHKKTGVCFEYRLKTPSGVNADSLLGAVRHDLSEYFKAQKTLSLNKKEQLKAKSARSKILDKEGSMKKEGIKKLSKKNVLSILSDLRSLCDPEGAFEKAELTKILCKELDLHNPVKQVVGALYKQLREYQGGVIEPIRRGGAGTAIVKYCITAKAREIIAKIDQQNDDHDKSVKQDVQESSPQELSDVELFAECVKELGKVEKKKKELKIVEDRLNSEMLVLRRRSGEVRSVMEALSMVK